MSNSTVYTCTKMPAANKIARMKPDSDGYFRCILGGYNLENHSGVPYPVSDKIRNMFKPGGSFHRMVTGANLRGEYGHPKVAGLSFQAMLARLMTVDEDRISHHIREAEIVDKKIDGQDVALVYGWVKPCGPKGEFLKESFMNPNENVCFSVRSTSDPVMWKGKRAKAVNNILNYDFVNEGGIPQANQYTTADLENLIDDITFTEDDLNGLLLPDNSKIITESGTANIKMVKENLGWRKVEIIDPISSLSF